VQAVGTSSNHRQNVQCFLLLVEYVNPAFTINVRYLLHCDHNFPNMTECKVQSQSESEVHLTDAKIEEETLNVSNALFRS